MFPRNVEDRNDEVSLNPLFEFDIGPVKILFC